MKITALADNIAAPPLCAIHGLSLHIQTQSHNMLFDLSTGGAIFQNAKILNVDLTAIDTVIISHGHDDHGGDLAAFLAINHTATVYIQRTAFERYYVNTPILPAKKYIGLDAALKNHPQIVLVDGDFTIDQELHLFRADTTSRLRSSANNTLYGEEELDTFCHEQNLMIYEGDKTALIMGCGHSGIVNILDKAAQWNPSICVGGYHLYNPTLKENVSDELLRDIGTEMCKYPIHFYTCHCTGEYAFQHLSQQVPQIEYLACSDAIEL